MSYNPNKLPKTNKPQYDTVPEEVYGARLARVIVLGQQEDKYGTKDKALMAFTVPELTINLKDSDGKEEEKQRMFWTFGINLVETQNPDAKITKYWNALNPEADGWEELLNSPCLLDIELKTLGKGSSDERKVNNIRGVTKCPKALTPDMPDCDAFVFDFYNPTQESWDKLGEYHQNTIKAAVNFEGSPVDRMLKGETVSQEQDEEAPI